MELCFAYHQGSQSSGKGRFPASIMLTHNVELLRLCTSPEARDGAKIWNGTRKIQEAPSPSRAVWWRPLTLLAMWAQPGHWLQFLFEKSGGQPGRFGPGRLGCSLQNRSINHAALAWNRGPCSNQHSSWECLIQRSTWVSCSPRDHSPKFLPPFVEPSVHPRSVCKVPTLWETLRRVLTFSCFTLVQPFATLWNIASQAPLSMEFPRQEYWSGLPFPPPGVLSDWGIQPASPASQADSLPLSHQGSP